jgi:hypothetical protein
MKKIFLIFILFFANFQNIFANDYDLSLLWDLGVLSPFLVDKIQINEKKEIELIYQGFDCDINGEFFLYIDWTNINLPCVWSNDQKTDLIFWSFEIDPWTYEIYFDTLNGDFYWINQVKINLKDFSNNSFVYTQDIYNETIREKIQIFENEEELKTFLNIQNWIVLFFLIFLLLYKIVNSKRFI